MTAKYESIPDPKVTAIEWHYFEPCELCNGILLYICKNIQTKQKTRKR